MTVDNDPTKQDGMEQEPVEITCAPDKEEPEKKAVKGKKLTPEQEAHLDCERELLEIKEQLESERKRNAELADSALRLQADFENYRKRNLESVRKSREDGREEVMSAMFPLSDIMDQALSMIKDDNVAMGVKMIKRQLLDILASFGVSEYDPMGEQFDAELHNAVARKEAEDAEPDTVVEVLNKGYKKDGKVLRHANVVIAQ